MRTSRRLPLCCGAGGRSSIAIDGAPRPCPAASTAPRSRCICSGTSIPGPRAWPRRAHRAVGGCRRRRRPESAPLARPPPSPRRRGGAAPRGHRRGRVMAACTASAAGSSAPAGHPDVGCCTTRQHSGAGRSLSPSLVWTRVTLDAARFWVGPRCRPMRGPDLRPPSGAGGGPPRRPARAASRSSRGQGAGCGRPPGRKRARCGCRRS